MSKYPIVAPSESPKEKHFLTFKEILSLRFEIKYGQPLKVADKNNIMGLLKILITKIIQLIAPGFNVKFVRVPWRIHDVNHYKIRDGF